MQQKQSKEQVVIGHIKKLANIVHPGESMHKVLERYGIDWTPDLVDKLDFKAWIYLWNKLCVMEQKRADAWIVLIADKEAEKENVETQK